MKKCIHCKMEKPLSEFNINHDSKDGHDYRCKSCKGLYDRDRILKQNPNKRTFRKLGISKSDSSPSEYYVYRKYGLKPREYDEFLEMQGGVCAICGNPPNGQRLSVDHDHKTGKIRGLLCHHCNAALGNAKDDRNILQKMIYYLLSKS